jgi:hypothetical protein
MYRILLTLEVETLDESNWEAVLNNFYQDLSEKFGSQVGLFVDEPKELDIVLYSDDVAKKAKAYLNAFGVDSSHIHLDED